MTEFGSTDPLQERAEDAGPRPASVARGHVGVRSLTFPARDGYALVGRVYQLSEGRAQAALLVSSATGYPQAFYRTVAEDAARRGFLVLTYDYRGIADSAPQDLSQMEMDYTDWGRLDMPAAVDALLQEASAAGVSGPPVHLAHSVGGHFLGFMDNQDALAAHAFVCVGSGYWGGHRLPMLVAGPFLWLVYGPIQVALHGYLPGGGLWSGAALPRGVFETWRRWCLTRRYFMDELAGRLAPNHFSEVRAPIRSYVMSDDPIAHRVSAQAMLDIYPNAARELIELTPSEFGLRALNHAGPLRRGQEAARAPILDWLADKAGLASGTAV